jgi:hypothetical protein
VLQVLFETGQYGEAVEQLLGCKPVPTKVTARPYNVSGSGVNIRSIQSGTIGAQVMAWALFLYSVGPVSWVWTSVRIVQRAARLRSVRPVPVLVHGDWSSGTWCFQSMRRLALQTDTPKLAA